MRALSRLPLLSLAYAQGQDPLTRRRSTAGRREMSRWWSDYDHVADLNTGAADVCTHALGHVYLVGRKESLESCNKAKQECFEEAKGVRKESFNLQEEVNTLRRTWGKMLMYPQKRITSSKYWPTVEPSRNSQGYY
ncbi:hypothetical protein RU639_002100 [Aspergillus parasiticus]